MTKISKFRNLAIFASFGLLTGCSASLPINRAIPVACQEEVPERPIMPTELLKPGAGLDAFVQAAAAEIERREGFEGRLHAALVACTKPVSRD